MRDLILTSRHGVSRRVSKSAAPIRNREGRILGAVLVFRDISEQLKMEEEVLKVQKLESLGILAGGIAHDFNNILAGILMKTQMAQRALTRGKDALRYLKSVEDATEVATGLTQQLLTFAKGGEPIKRVLSVGTLVRESALFAIRGSAVGCEFDLSRDLWPVEVDQAQISQVINNLVINADQAMPSGGKIRITARNLEVTAGEQNPDLEVGRYVHITVQDQGTGIAREDLPRVFDPYFTTKPRGQGLGLASTYSIIRRHGGRITVESELGKGSTFHVYLPASRKQLGPNTGVPREVPRGSGRVLVMDDDKLVRESLADLLRELGYQVELAEDGEEALRRYRERQESQQPFDLVIMDLTIPGGMGGKEAVGHLRKIDPEALVIVSSGYSRDPVMANFRDYGFDAVLSKPYSFETVGRLWSETLQVKGERRPLTIH